MKLRLEIESLTDDFFCETRLLGIMAPIKNYQFCWMLNSLLGYRFRLSNELEKQVYKKGRTYFFKVYEHLEMASPLKHYLYHNHCDGEYLLPDVKHLDYLWLMKGDLIDEIKCMGIVASVKSISGVQIVADISGEAIRYKERMIF